MATKKLYTIDEMEMFGQKVAEEAIAEKEASAPVKAKKPSPYETLADLVISDFKLKASQHKVKREVKVEFNSNPARYGFNPRDADVTSSFVIAIAKEIAALNGYKKMSLPAPREDGDVSKCKGIIEFIFTAMLRHNR